MDDYEETNMRNVAEKLKAKAVRLKIFLT